MLLLSLNHAPVQINGSFLSIGIKYKNRGQYDYFEIGCPRSLVERWRASESAGVLSTANSEDRMGKESRGSGILGIPNEGP